MKNKLVVILPDNDDAGERCPGRLESLWMAPIIASANPISRFFLIAIAAPPCGVHPRREGIPSRQGRVAPLFRGSISM